MAEDASPDQPLGDASRPGERYLAHALRIARVGSWEWDAGADRVLWTDELYRIYGVEPGTPMDYDGYLARVHPDDRERVSAAVAGLLRTGQPIRLEERIVRPDGSVRILESRGEAVRDGGAVRLIGVCRDVTERKEMEEALRQREHELEHALSIERATLESTADGILVVDRAGKVIRYNAKFLEMWHVPEELAAAGDDDVLLGSVLGQLKDPEGFVAQVRALYAQPERESFDVLEFQDGRTFERYSKPQRVAGASVGRVWSFRDVTERRRASAALRASEIRYRLLFEQSPAGAYRTTLGGRLLACNDVFVRMFGYDSREELAAVPATELYFASADREAFIAMLREKGSLTNLETRMRRKDGTPVWIVENVALIDGEEPHIVGMAIDVTERKHLEGQLRQSQKMEAIGRLAGGVAHDFNNLLTTVIGFSDLVLGGLPADSPIRPDLEEIRRAGERAADLTRQLLAFSRQQLVEMRSLGPNTVVREVDKMLRRLIGEDVELVLHLEPDVGVVRGDPGQLEQVLVNLAVNARDAMPRGGRLTIETARVEVGETSADLATAVPAGRYSVITVADTGTGMDAETQRHIFEPFYTTKARGKGTGLGLATVYGIVKQSGGYIHVTSAPGEGTVFEIFLPEADGFVESRVTPPPMRIEAAAGETVLLVEDEPSVKWFVSRVLAQQGYSLLVASNGEEALRVEASHAGPIQLLLTDWLMPGLKGNELAAAMRARRPGIKVIYMSGYAEEAYARQGVLEPGVPFLAKPVTAAVVAAQVRKVLDR